MTAENLIWPVVFFAHGNWQINYTYLLCWINYIDKNIWYHDHGMWWSPLQMESMEFYWTEYTNQIIDQINACFLIKLTEIN